MKKRVFLIGGYNKTRTLAESLIKKGYDITAINRSMKHCKALAEIEGVNVFNGDGSQPFILEDANAYNADIAIALTERDDDNLVICELCKKKFNVKKTVTLISDAKKTEFFERMGIDSVVCAISAIAGIIEQQAFFEEMSTLVTMSKGRIRITQVSLPHSAPAVSKKLIELGLPKDVIIGCVLRGEKSIVPHGHTRVYVGDVLVLISTDEHEALAIHKLLGTVRK
ncbi:MAG: NAD-binding protein [Oscillospiraceae bacterium]|nr:NAD-binding protein [Oscillospiraceae bacterium]